MEDIKLNADNSPNTNNKNKEALIAIIAVIVFVVIVVVCVVALTDDSSSTSNKIEISGTQLHVDYTEYLGYSATITGIAKNVTRKSFSYVSVEFSVYDSNGNNIGTALANINNLGAGDTWRFEAVLFSFPSTRPSSFKLVEITAF